jgi:hypothetical protein
MKDSVPKVGMLVKVLGVLAAGTVPYSCTYAGQGAKLLYYAEDMLAALLLFFVAFSAVAMMSVILFLLDEGLYRVLACVGLYVVHTTQRLHRCCLHVSQLGRQYFHDISTILSHW